MYYHIMLNYLTLQYYCSMTSFCEFMISQMNISRKDEYLTNFTIVNRESKHKVNQIQHLFVTIKY